MTLSPSKAPSFVLILFLWIGMCSASANQIQTTPRISPLHLVSWVKNGPINPQISMQADFVTYPNYPSYKQYLGPKDTGSPEQTAARYLQTLAEGTNNSVDETIDLAKRFYDEGAVTVHEDWVSRHIVNEIKGLTTSLRNNPDARFWHRYDVGPVSFIVLCYSKSNQIRPSATIFCLHKVGESYRILPDAFSVSRTLHTIQMLIYLNDSHMIVKGETLNNVPLPFYEYRYRMPNPIQGNTSTEHPLDILFNGRPSNILVSDDMIPSNWGEDFIKRAGKLNLNYFLESTDWTDQDAYIPPSGLGFEPINVCPHKYRIVFTIDFGVQYLFFVRADGSKELRKVIVSKATNHEESLDKPEHFPGNLLRLIDSPEFRLYLSDKVAPVAQANSPTKATVR